jgi:iron complex outermembrane recepter protein
MHPINNNSRVRKTLRRARKSRFGQAIAPRLALALAFLSCCAWQLPAQAPPADLTQLSVEDLMNVTVTSASKKEQKLSRVAAAVFVITRDDIRNSGALNIPDLLRMVPGLNVAQINASTWAISARGFNGEFSDKLLVLLDGRSVYLPTTSGVFWDVLDVPLADIERIEVIRGPGGASWGANAVNGVINIITRRASDARGGTVSIGGGNLAQGFATAEYGDKFGSGTDYRVFGKYLNDDHQPNPSGLNDGDGWHALRAGFRTDTQLSSSDELSFTGDLYTSRAGFIRNSFPASASLAPVATFSEANGSGGYLQGDWNHRISEQSDASLQISFDRYRLDDDLREARNTLNAEFDYHFAWGGRQDVVCGAGYRYSSSTTDGNLVVSLLPANLDTQLFSGFVQDELTLAPERLWLTLGGKIEHNYYTGFGFMPTARAAWSFRQGQLLWAAVSRALRTPSSTDTSPEITLNSVGAPGGPPVLLQLAPSPAFRDETEIAYELGYRSQFSHRLSLDISAYFNVYHQLATEEPGAPLFAPTPLPAHEVLPLYTENLMHGETHGLEFSGKWQITAKWTLTPAYSFEQLHLQLSPASRDTQTLAFDEGGTPRHWARLDSQLVLPHRLQWSASANYVGRLSSLKVPSYTRVDTQLLWQVREHLSAKLVGQNLLRDRHLEFTSQIQSVFSSLVKRSAYVEWTWSF